MQGDVLSRANPSLILSSKSLVLRKVDENERANFGVQQLPLFNLLAPEELDWQVCLLRLEGKRRLDTRVPLNLHSSKHGCGNGLKRCHLEMGLEIPSGRVTESCRGWA